MSEINVGDLLWIMRGEQHDNTLVFKAVSKVVEEVTEDGIKTADGYDLPLSWLDKLYRTKEECEKEWLKRNSSFVKSINGNGGEKR